MKTSTISIKKLKDICKVVSGATPKTIKPEYWDGDIPWVTPKDLSSLKSMYLSSPERSITKAGFDSCSTQMIPARSLLLSSRAPIGHLAINEVDVCTNQGFKSLIPNKEIHPEYLYFCIKYFVPQLKRLGRGATFTEISKDIVENFEIPVMPFDHQKFIAEKLTTAYNVIEVSERRLIELDNYLRSLFIEMFGDPVANPKNWPKKKFKSVAKITTGNTPSRAKPEYYGDYIEWIKSDNLNNPFHYATKATEFLSEAGAKVGRVVPPNSILVTCIAGSKECIGNAAIVDRSVAFNQQINSITCGNELIPEFVYSFVLVGKRLIQSASTNSMKGMVSKGNFEEIEIYTPPKELQLSFAKRFSTCNDLKLKIKESEREMQSMFSSSLSEAFTGTQ